MLVSSVCDHGWAFSVGEMRDSPEIARFSALLFVEAVSFVIEENDRVGARYLNARMDFVSCEFGSSCNSAAVLAVLLQKVRDGFLV